MSVDSGTNNKTKKWAKNVMCLTPVTPEYSNLFESLCNSLDLSNIQTH